MDQDGVNTDQDGRELPSEVTVSSTPAFRPNELRVLKAETGRTMESIMDDEVDAMQTMIWSALRTAGFNPTWEQCGDIGAAMDVTPDPTTGDA